MGAAIQGLALSSVGANGPLKATRVGVQGSGGSKTRARKAIMCVQNHNMNVYYTYQSLDIVCT